MSTSTGTESSREAPRVLVVDDDSSLVDLVQGYLGSLGYHVEVAQEREEAEALLVHRSFDLLISDLGLTEVNRVEGLDLVAFAHWRNPGARVLVLTSDGSGPVEAEALRRGADAYLVKPQPLRVLSDTVAVLIGRP